MYPYSLTTITKSLKIMTIKVKCGHKIIPSRKILIEKKCKKNFKTVMKDNLEVLTKRATNPKNKEAKCR